MRIIMTPDEFKQKMEDMKDKYDPEKRHDVAEDLLCDVLSELGYSEGVEIFKRMTLW